jgi:Flp pilus assembly protein TadG
MASMTRFLRRARGERGAQLVEFALVLPVLLFVVLGIADFGIVFQRYEVLTNAAREGARMAVLPGYSDNDVRVRVRAYLTAARVPWTSTNPTITPVAVSIAMGAGQPPITAKQVTVTYTHSYMFIGGIASMFGATFTTLPLTAVSEMRSEAPPGT